VSSKHPYWKCVVGAALKPISSKQLQSKRKGAHIFFKDLFIYWRETESTHRRAGERGDREKETWADSMLSAEPDTGLDLTTLRSRPKLKPRVRHSTDCATQGPPHTHRNMPFKHKHALPHWFWAPLLGLSIVHECVCVSSRFINSGEGKKEEEKTTFARNLLLACNSLAHKPTVASYYLLNEV